MKKTGILIAVMVIAVSVFGSYPEEPAVTALAGEKAMKAEEVISDAGVAEKIKEATGIAAAEGEKFVIFRGAAVDVVVVEQRGRWGIIKLAVAVNKSDKSIKAVEILSMSEKRGAGIKTTAFLNQFISKKAGDDYAISKGIRGITGATISSQAVLNAVKKALAVYGLK